MTVKTQYSAQDCIVKYDIMITNDNTYKHSREKDVTIKIFFISLYEVDDVKSK